MDKSEIARRMRSGEKGISLSSETQFKEGHVPHNWLPVGSKTIRIDKNGTSRKWIKISEPNIWIPYAVHVWTTHGGEIPKGFILHHIDHDAINDSIDNLSLVTRATHAKLHMEEMREAMPKRTHIKDKVCPDCGLEYQGRGKSVARCSDCAHKANNESRRRYKERQSVQQIKNVV